MAEEWGMVTIKADSEVLSLLKSEHDAADFLMALSQQSGGFSKDVMNLNSQINDLEVINGYASFDFDCSDWKAIMEMLIAKGKGIELYGRTVDEYGIADFYSRKADGEIKHFTVEQGGDMCEVDEYIEDAMAKIKKWETELPEEVKSSFPDFSEVQNIMFDGP